MVTTSERLEQFMARAEIHDVLYRYCHACDRRDPAMLKSVYHPGAVDNHNTFNGPADAFVDYIMARFEQVYALTQHHITNINIEFHGDTAYVESYFIAYHRHKNDFDRDSQTGGRYVDRFEKRDGKWLIASRDVVVDWTADLEHLKPTDVAHMHRWGAYGDADLSRQRLPEHRRPG
jgi:3-phenylpropionate/cinnamic acid dioxygenase small subunit